jgi:hypothetical protein
MIQVYEHDLVRALRIRGMSEEGAKALVFDLAANLKENNGRLNSSYFHPIGGPKKTQEAEKKEQI